MATRTLQCATQLMEMQRLLLDKVLCALPRSPNAYAYVPGRSVVDCAQVHLRAHTVIRLDIADFFPSIRERHVFHALLGDHEDGTNNRQLRRYVYELACLTTVSPRPSGTWRNRGTGLRTSGDRLIPRRFPYQGQHEGFLPQGAPTSGVLSNLVMRDVDQRIYAIADSLGLRFTRYSDDLHFSARHPVSDQAIDQLIGRTRRELAALGLHLNDDKTWVAGPGARRAVLGILVDGASPRLPRPYKRRIEVHVRGAARHGLEDHAAHRAFPKADDLDAHVTGLLAHARLVEPQWAAPRWQTWQRLRALAADPRGGAPTTPASARPTSDAQSRATRAATRPRSLGRPSMPSSAEVTNTGSLRTTSRC